MNGIWMYVSGSLVVIGMGFVMCDSGFQPYLSICGWPCCDGILLLDLDGFLYGFETELGDLKA